MSTAFNLVRADHYVDSVALMRLALRIAELPGVEDASVMMGTPGNLQILADAAMLTGAGRAASAGDLVIALLADAEASAQAAAGRALEWLADGEAGLTDASRHSGGWQPRSVGGAERLEPHHDLALISVPGEYAAAEAYRALDQGLNVMVFSDNVSIADEVAMKRRAERMGRLVMGPDCGTAILAGTPIGFANAVPRGGVGIVAASGTGAQELSVLLARAGAGTSHIIGVGGRDLDRRVGAVSTLRAIAMLAADPATEQIAVVSKPPHETVAAAVLAALQAADKPGAACFVGARARGAQGGISTLEATASTLLGREHPELDPPPPAPGARRGTAVRGLFSGGTLCAEAQTVMAAAGLSVRSNAPIPGLAGGSGAAHLLLDLGADELTRGRPHPMIEPAVRTASLSEALNDPEVGVVLLDVVLGFASHRDPATPVANALNAAPSARPVVIAYVCGIEGDPQGYESQCEILRRAGVFLAPSNAAAARAAAHLGLPGGGTNNG